jgi:hypothetical protein
VYTKTGSYRPAILAMSGYFVVAILLALYAAGRKQVTRGEAA